MLICPVFHSLFCLLSWWGWRKGLADKRCLQCNQYAFSLWVKHREKNTCWTAIGYVGQSHLGPESIWPEWGSQIENTSMLNVLCDSWVLLCHYHLLLHVSHVSVSWIFVTSWSFLCQFSFSTYILYLHYWCLTYLSSILLLYLVLSIILVCLLFLIYIFFLNKLILRCNRVNILMNLCF